MTKTFEDKEAFSFVTNYGSKLLNGSTLCIIVSDDNKWIFPKELEQKTDIREEATEGIVIKVPQESAAALD